MTISQILKAKEILCIVPDARKAQAVKNCFGGKVSPVAPASALQNHANTTVYLDKDSSSLLSPEISVEQIGGRRAGGPGRARGTSAPSGGRRPSC